MNTYSEIELYRTTKRAYVNYQYYRISASCPDAFNPFSPWCIYWVSGENGVSKKSVFEETLVKRDKYKSPEYFKRICDAIYKAGAFEKYAVHFDRLTTTSYPYEIELNLKLAIYGGADINVENLVSDLEKCRNKRDVFKVFELLSAQVYAASVNGAFVKLFTEAENSLAGTAYDISKINLKVHSLICSYYSTVINGAQNRYPLRFPAGELDFKFAKEIYEIGHNLSKIKDATEDYVCSFLERHLSAVLDANSKLFKKR